jgi:bifunctional non-homologous end joining protein LigD
MPSSFIEPCLPSPADRPPSGSNWIHEIKHDGYRLMATRDPVGIGLITRRGNNWTTRFPLIVEAVNHLKVRSCRPGVRLNDHARLVEVQEP